METDRISGIIFFAIGVAVCLGSLSYPVGARQKPGRGLFPLLPLRSVLSALFIFQSFTAQKGETSGADAFCDTTCAVAGIVEKEDEGARKIGSCNAFVQI